MLHNKTDKDKLYKLLPELYRERDSIVGYPLQAILKLITEQVELLEDDIKQLWNNFFIDTCDKWVIPYIGDLVGNNLLHDIEQKSIADYVKKLFEDLNGYDLNFPDIIRTRTDVAKTIYYRRRKGTLPMLEELARDVTGWAAHAVAFFEILNTTQNLNHLRLFNRDCPDLRQIEPLDRINGPFDSISHTVDVRSITQNQGWYNIKNIGFFLWRLKSYPLENVVAKQAGLPWQFYFSPLGNNAPLFTRRRREASETGLATELDVPGPVRKSFFYEDLKKLSKERTDHTDLYALFYPIEGNPIKTHCQGSFFIFINGENREPVQPAIIEETEEEIKQQIVCRNLEEWPLTQPDGKIIGIDVENGRMVIGSEWNSISSVDVYYHYGFSADMGGGPYDRTKCLVKPSLPDKHYYVKEDRDVPPEISSSPLSTLEEALVRWEDEGRQNTLITILDSRSYKLPPLITLNDKNWLVIEAENNQRPLLKVTHEDSAEISSPDELILEIDVSPPSGSAKQEHAAEITFSGVVIEGWIKVIGDLGRLRIIHSTLIPGICFNKDYGTPKFEHSSIIINSDKDTEKINTELNLEIAFSISGPIRIPDHASGLVILDSIIDGFGQQAIGGNNSSKPGPLAKIERTTIFGSTFLQKLELANEVIFTGEVIVSYIQGGCLRFCYISPESRTPRKYRCQPNLEAKNKIKKAEKEKGEELSQDERDIIADSVQSWLKPVFTSQHYGSPAYAQLGYGCPVQISKGSEEECEMGTFCHLKQAQREANLKIRLKEYLPFGLNAGMIYIT